MNRIQKVLGSVAITSLVMLAPLAASASTLSATSSTGVIVSPNGIVRVIGADVTAVGTNVIDAVLNVGNTVINVVLNTSGNTKVAANGSKTATTTDIKVGDTVAFKGTLSSSTNGSLTVAATKVRDLTTLPFRYFGAHASSTINAFFKGKSGKDVGNKATINASVKGDDSHGIHAGLNLFGGLHI